MNNRGRKKGFTIAEVIIALTIIMLFAALCIEACMMGLSVSTKTSKKVSVMSASSEFITCFRETENASSSDDFLNKFNARLLISLDIVTASADYTIDGDNFKTNGSKSLKLTYGERTLDIVINSDSMVSYSFESSGYMQVNATVKITSAMPYNESITVKGYAEGISAAVCEYSFEVKGGGGEN